MIVKKHFFTLKILFTLCVIVFAIHPGKSQHAQRDTIFAKEILTKANTLTDNGAYEASDKIAMQAAEIFQEQKAWTLLSNTYNTVFYNGLYRKKYDIAIALIEKALPTIPSSEISVLGELQYILGYCYERQGLIFKALTYYEKSLVHFTNENNAFYKNQVYGNISQIYIQQGEFEKAVTYLKYAISDGKSSNDTRTVWINTKALSEAYFYLQEYELAQETYKEAQRIMDDKDGTFEYFEAQILYEFKAYEKALVTTQNAIKLTEKCKNDSTKNPYYCTLNYYNLNSLLGDIYVQLGAIDKAIAQFQKCLSLLEETGNLRDIAKLYIRIGDCFKTRKQYDNALANYQQALHVFIPEFNDADPEKNPPEDVWNLEVWLMEIFKHKGDCFFNKYQTAGNEKWLHIAAANYDTAVIMSEKVRLNFSETKSKLHLGSDTNTLYEALIQVKLALYKRTKDAKYQQEAFQIAQRANAFVLRGLINEKQAFKAAHIPKDTISLFQEYTNKITTLTRKIEDSIDFETSQKELIHTKEALLHFKKRIAINYPKFDKLRNDLDGISIATIQEQLKEDELFIKYFLGETTLCIFTISNTHFYTDEIAVSEKFQTILTQYREAISNIQFINTAPDIAEKQYLQTAYELYTILLEKPLHHTKEQNIKSITIVPDGSLYTIPFQALLTKNSDNWTTVENTVLKKYAVSYHYFCKMIHNTTETQAKNDGFTAFGLELNPQTIDATGDITAENQINNTNLRGNTLSKLTYSDDEALVLAKLMQGNSWINEKATKANFITHASNATGIHLATHSLVDIENPNSSALVFTKTNDSTNNLLRLDEIYNHYFNANMITLSACNTGFGKNLKGEGLQSLARAFNFARIPSVTATLWSIPDASSSTIMELYYTYLQKGYTKNVALQKAQIEYLENDEISSPASRLPFYWSAWTHIGDHKTITLQQKNSVSNYIFGTLASIIILGGVFWYQKKRTK